MVKHKHIGDCVRYHDLYFVTIFEDGKRTSVHMSLITYLLILTTRSIIYHHVEGLEES